MTITDYAVMAAASSFLNVQFIKLNNQLAILQFGGNVTPYVKNRSSLNGVKQSYNSVCTFPAMPSALVAIGVNDVARSVGGTYVSYQWWVAFVMFKRSCPRGCAFLTFKLMGGENSVLSWHKKAGHQGWAF